MKKLFLKFCLGAIAALASLSLAVSGTGLASADIGLAGMTYADAKAFLKDTPTTVTSVNGGRLEMDKCLVTNSRRSKTLNASGVATGVQVLLDLNCNGGVATAGAPGPSAGSPEGRAAKEDQRLAKAIDDNPDICAKDMQRCKIICNRTGLCSI